MHPQRRSGRIPKEIPIVLLGTDTAGKVFAEETCTVVLSRHGAGILSKYRFAPDEILTLRLAGSAKEAEIRLVGQIGGEPGRYVHGVAFVDPNLDFWPMEFPPPEGFAPASRQVTLECAFCQTRQSVHHDEIEEDVYSINGNVLRLCDVCGTSTPWKKATGAASFSAPDEKAPPKPVIAPLQPPPQHGNVSSIPKVSSVAVPVPPISPPLPAPTAASTSFYASTVDASSFERSSSVATSPTYSAAPLETLPTSFTETSIAVAPLPFTEVPSRGVAPVATGPSSVRPLDGKGRPANRRKHMRIRVSFSACIRLPGSANEVVECENVSKGGLCFRSQRQYPLGSTIEIAAPFSPGEPALFVSAKIRRVERLGETPLLRYGAAYLESTPT